MQSQSCRTEAPDPLWARDLLLGTTSPDVVRVVVRDLLSAGWTPARLLAEIPTINPELVRSMLEP
jgi:hypothetical protein